MIQLGPGGTSDDDRQLDRDEVGRLVFEQRAVGFRWREIAAHFGVSERTCQRWLRAHIDESGPAETIEADRRKSLAAIEMAQRPVARVMLAEDTEASKVVQAAQAYLTMEKFRAELTGVLAAPVPTRRVDRMSNREVAEAVSAMERTGEFDAVVADYLNGADAED